MIQHKEINTDLYIQSFADFLVKFPKRQYIALALHIVENSNSNPCKDIKNQCIDLAKKWIESGKKPSKNLLGKIRRKIIDHREIDYGCFSLLESILEEDKFWSSLHSSMCIHTECKEDQTKHTKIKDISEFRQRFSNSISLSKSFLTTTNFKHTKESKSFLQYDANIESVSALIDYLLDNNENIVLFETVRVKLNLPNDELIQEENLSDLIKTISRSVFLTDYLKRLYS